MEYLRLQFTANLPTQINIFSFHRINQHSTKLPSPKPLLTELEQSVKMNKIVNQK